MAGLEDLGIAGPSEISNILSHDDPMTAITEFQGQNGILLPSLKPALNLLDLHGVPRRDFHLSTLEEMREKLLKRVQELAASGKEEDQKRLVELLEKSFPIAKVKHVRPVVLCVLEHIPKIDKQYLDRILQDKDLLREVAVPVKRQIWEDRLNLFADACSPLISEYVSEKETALFSQEHGTLSFFLPNPKARRQGAIVAKLVYMIGRNTKLYHMVVNFLRTLFLRKRNVHYCTLRVEILMALHDAEVNEIISVDPIHKFAWCVDACVRERNINPNLQRELQGLLDGIRKGQESILGDLSMVLCDPFALNTVVLSAMKLLQHCINTDTLPRENTDLQLLMRMIALGLGAWDMNDSGVYKEPKMDPHLFTKYLPTIVGMMADDQTRAVMTKIPDAVIKPPQLPSELYAIFIKQSPIASIIAMYYVLQAARQKDRMVVMEVLPTLIHCENDRAYEDTFLHSLASYLIPCGEDFSSDDFCQAVLDDFFVPAVSMENVRKHVMRLLWYVHPFMSPDRLSAVMETMQPDQDHSEAVHKTFAALKTKIEEHMPEPVPVPEVIDSPLLSVPVPTPMIS
ncbi:negative elongation factor B-like [Babylonia areolata]|uniref:negative elongation factor B-like n=1 Tax=Babylonia areolata TaxID=304850 RepID=UPI003FD02B93